MNPVFKILVRTLTLQCSICQIECIQKLHHSYCIRSIPGHCDLQTDISNCLGDIISCPQIDLTLPAGANYLCIQF